MSRNILTQEQINQFKQEGYLVVNDLLSENDLSALTNEYNEVLNRLCQDWLEQGIITKSYVELAFEERLVELFKAGCDYASHMDISLPFTGITKTTAIHLGEKDPAINYNRWSDLASALCA